MAASWNARQPGTETEDRQQAAGEEVGSPGGITDTGADRQVRIGHANHGDQEDGGGRHTKHGDDDPEDDGSQDGDGTIRGLCLDLVDHVDARSVCLAAQSGSVSCSVVMDAEPIASRLGRFW